MVGFEMLSGPMRDITPEKVSVCETILQIPEVDKISCEFNLAKTTKTAKFYPREILST